MRPLRLRMQAFGPYQRQTIDFGRLDDRNLFLIHGPTGSGKTTILDAVAFALYGESSGDERDGRGMRSDLAPEDLLTEVEFEFALGERRFRLMRSPEQVRPRRRGTGFVIQAADATLWEVRDGAPEGTLFDDQGRAAGGETVRATGAGAVTREVQRLLGFDGSQFRQVILLPQGDFRRLLTAGSKEREAILEVLFDTSRFRRLQDGLREAQRTLAAAAERSLERRRFLLEHLDADEPQAAAARLEDLVVQLARAEEACGELRERAGRAEEALEAGRDAAARLAEAAQAREALGELDFRADQMHARRQEVAQAARAAGAEHAVRQRERVRTRADELRERVEQQAAALQALEAERERAAARTAAERGRSAEAETLQRELHTLEGLGATVARLAEARSRRDEAGRAQAAADEASAQAETRLAGARESERELTGAIEELRGVAAEAAVTKREADDLEQAAERARRRAQLDSEVRHLHGRVAAAGREAAAADTALRAAEAEAAAMETAWMRGQAAVLGRALVAGEPCPVCGSSAHPAPAQGEDLPDEAELERARRSLETARAERDAAEARLREFEHTASTVATQIATLDEVLGEWAGRGGEELGAAAAAAARRHRESVGAGERLSELRGRLEACRREGETAEEELGRARAAAAAAAADEAAAAALVRAAEDSVPPELHEPSAVEAARTKAAARLESLRADLEAAEAAERQVREAASAATASLESAREHEADGLRELEEAEAGLAVALAKADFPDLGAWRRASRAAEQVSALETELAEYDRALAAARARVDRAEAGAAGLTSPDLAALQATAEQARSALEAGLDERSRLAGQRERTEALLAQLSDVEEELRGQEDRLAVLGRLAEVGVGDNPSRVSFQRFVLGALLDQVLDAASLRLRAMSRGRFELQRVRESGDRRRSAGLDLEVFDGHTGMARPANTLSGGEGFLASLALALGLADTVQSYAGGVRLDTMFIDEGFGSLDPEALDAALATLVDLQAGGRLVGIISHVPELRERIDVRLEIAPNRGGSTASFCLP